MREVLPYINLGAIIVGIIGLLLTIAKNKRDRVESDTKLRERITTVETKMEVFWRAVAIDSAKILHTPHPQNWRRDELLEKFVAQTISRDELLELISVLTEIVENKIRDFGERAAASTMLRAIEMQYEI